MGGHSALRYVYGAKANIIALFDSPTKNKKFSKYVIS